MVPLLTRGFSVFFIPTVTALFEIASFLKELILSANRQLFPIRRLRSGDLPQACMSIVVNLAQCYQATP
jgi:hypothetical protein